VGLEAAWGSRAGEAALGITDDPEVAGYEGQVRLLVVRHRRREKRVRDAKIEATLAATGRLVCEVRGCGFDFEARYGSVGRGFAHVHHLKPLASLDSPRLTTLADVAVVCANCHAMIHIGGECRPLDKLIADVASGTGSPA
jgi:5-methylcytosine-specific restriction enzyme A